MMEAIATKQEEKYIQELSKEILFETKYNGGYMTSTTDGKYLIWTNDDGTTVNVSTIHGKVLFSYKGDTSDVLTMVVSKNNKYLAVSYSSGLVYIYDLTIPREHLMIIKTPNTSTKQQSVSVSLAFSYSNGFLAMGSNDGFVRVYDLENKFFTHNLVFSHSLVSHVLFDDTKEQYLVYAACDTLETIRQFNLHTNKSKDMFGHLNGISDMKLNDKKELISIGKDNVLIYWNMQTLKPLKTIGISYSILLQVIGENVLIGTEEGNLLCLKQMEKEPLWQNEEEQRLLKPRAILLADDKIIHVSYDGYLIFYSMDGSVISYDCFDRESVILCLPLDSLDSSSEGNSDNEDKMIEESHTDENEKSDESENKKIENKLKSTKMLILNNSNSIEIHDFITETSQLYYGHDSVVISYCVSPAKDYLFVGYYDGFISLWELETMTELFTMNIHSGPITALAHSTKTNIIASGSNDKFIKIFKYDTETLTQLHAFAAHSKEIQCLTYSKKDLFLVSGSSDKTAKLWVPAQEYALQGTLKGHTRGVLSAAFSPIEQVVLTTSTDGTIRLWSVNSLAALRTLQGHNGGVCNAIFVNDGIQIVSIGNDGTIRLWIVKTGENIQTIDVSESKLWSILPHYKDFIVTGDDGVIALIKDISTELVNERIASREKEILLSQQLMNLTRQGKWKEALKVCVELDLPKEAFNCCSNCNISEAIEDWPVELGKKLYSFAKIWNERNVSMVIAQKVLNALFLRWNMNDLVDDEFKKSLERMKDLNTKHMNTLESYYRNALFISFVADQIKALPNAMEEDE